MALKQSLAISLDASDQSTVKVPSVGERVSVAGETGEFMVVRFDRERHLVDLMRMTGGCRRVETGVPLYTLRPIDPTPQKP